MAADTYPVDGIQSLALVDCVTGEYEIIGKFRHQNNIPISPDQRCDLHPRWSSDGSVITVDSIHNGQRQIYMLERK